ncbi:MAG: hypothetical protein J2P49_11315 [Methylocapsa sp.]|nr:hypothetical protein [Methylocapsa sp.]
MNATLAVVGPLAGAFFFGSAARVAKSRTVWRFLQFFGSACLIVVVLTHIAETAGLLTSMGWGLPNSAGHYLDFISAILGLTLFPLGIFAEAVARRKNLS